MVAAIMGLLQQAHGGPSSAAEAGAVETAKAAGGHEVAWLVEQANYIFGPAALKVQQAVMPSIYGLFGAHWHEPQ
ncbi:MAG TPA: hypothetical protein VLU47_05790, partial [Blastocatellia bacterium]|nr:hypothetical protein [Blastocatellia bacterium]